MSNQFDLWELLVNQYLGQDDIVSSVTYLNKDIHSICERKLYRNLKVTSSPFRNYKSKNNTVYGFKHTIINGFSIKGACSNKKDQSDHILYSKLLNLFQAKNIDRINTFTESFIINDDCFYDKDNFHIFEDFIGDFNDKGNMLLNNFKINMDLPIYDYIFSSLINDKNFKNIKHLQIDNINHFKAVPESICGKIESLTLKNINETVDLNIFENLNHLIVLDTESLFNCKISNDNKITKLNINLLHSTLTDHVLKNYNKEIDLLHNIYWEQITDLSLAYNCLLSEDNQCECINYFILSFEYFERLINLQSLTLSQSLHDKSSKIERFNMNSIPILNYWDDVVVDIFMLLPTATISKKITTLRMLLYPSMNGHAKNISDGYYTLRVKKIMHLKEILDQNCKLLSLTTGNTHQTLGSLEVLDIPQFLQSLIQIPILSNDLLWNGCQCAICRPTLEIIDKYLHDHLWFRRNISNSGGFGSGVSNKFQELENSEMFAFMSLPIEQYCEDLDSIIDGNGLDCCWDFHEDLYNGEDMKLIHYSDDQHDDHCSINDLHYSKIVLQTFEHFLDLYLDHFLFSLPNLKLLVLSGFAYRIDMNRYGSFILSDIYDE